MSYSEAIIMIYNCNKNQDIVVIKDAKINKTIGRSEAIVLDKKAWDELKYFIQDTTNWEEES